VGSGDDLEGASEVDSEVDSVDSSEVDSEEDSDDCVVCVDASEEDSDDELDLVLRGDWGEGSDREVDDESDDVSDDPSESSLAVFLDDIGGKRCAVVRTGCSQLFVQKKREI
jgi:hypothetical protein